MTKLLGHIQRGSDGTLIGELRCPVFGNVWLLVGTRTTDGYVLEATPGPIPEGQRIPFVDDCG